MLMGEFQHNLDAKGRLFMPVKLREALGTKFVLTKGLDGCLFVYDLEQWRLLEAKLNSLPMTRKAPVILTVSFLAVLPKVSAINRDGYFLPVNLREFAGLDKNAVIVGVGNRAEIWDAERWNAYNEENAEDVGELAEQLADLDLGI